MKRLTDKNYWESFWKSDFDKVNKVGRILKRVFYKGIMVRFVRNHVPKVDCNKEVIEIGCYPGELSRLVGKLGYRLNGIDFVDAVNNMKQGFLDDGLHVGEIIQGDFFEYSFDKKYDLVMSFGFIEHFEEYRDVIARHCDLVKGGGRLIITTPNYRKGLQNKMLKYFNQKETFDKHVLDSMRPQAWKEVCEKNGLKVVWYGYFGTPAIPMKYKNIGGGFLKTLINIMLCIALRIIRLIPLLFKSKRGYFSLCCGIVAIK
jgi:2-polyprenyl-3-methyl-5-hydroxy-6-metoxy-1,4-benzoquinol methylase